MRRLLPLLLVAAGAWGQSLCGGYNNYATFTIPAVPGTGSTPLVNYVARVYVTWAGPMSGGQPDLRVAGSGGGVISSSGFDIQFAASFVNTAALKYFRQNYTSTTGFLWAEVQIPSFVPNTGYSGLVCYGKVGDTDHSTGTALGAVYYGWYPLQENGSPYHDYASGNNSTSSGTGSYPAQTTGFLGNAQQFTFASHNNITIPQQVFSGGGSQESWLFATSTAHDMNWGDPRPNACSGGAMISGIRSSDGFAHSYVDNGGSFPQLAGSTNLTGAWHHIAQTAGGGTQKLYVDGALIASGSGVVNAGFTSTMIGEICSNGWQDGKIQDFRTTSNAVLTADWIASDYYLTKNAPIVTASAASNLPVITAFSCTNVAQGASTSCTYTTLNATTTTVTGSCPWSPSGCVYTGASPAVFEVEWNTSFKLYAVNANGRADSPQTAITVTPGSSTGANPVLSGVSVTGSTATSVWFAASSTTPSSWVGTCTMTGSPFTAISTPTLWPINYGGAAYPSYGVEVVKFAITGLSPSTQYNCHGAATNDHGTTPTSDTTITTPALPASTPFVVNFTSGNTYARNNDHRNGAYGASNTGVGGDGDTQHVTHSDDDRVFGNAQDGFGINGALTSAGANFVIWDSAMTSPVQLGGNFAGGSYNAMGSSPIAFDDLHSNRGVLYSFYRVGYAPSFAPQIMKSTDHGLNWCSFVTCGANGPNTAPATGFDPAPVVSVSVTSNSTYSSPNITLHTGAWSTQPTTGQELHISGSTNCDGFQVVVSATSTSVTFASANVACNAGTVNFVRSTVGALAIGASNWAPRALRVCQDQTQNCTYSANDDGWQFFTLDYSGLAAMRHENLYLGDLSLMRCYNGTQGTSDWLTDPGSWPLCTAATLTTMTGGLWSEAQNGDNQQPVISYDATHNRWALHLAIGTISRALSAAIADLGPYPNGNATTIAGTLAPDAHLYPGVSPSFPNPLMGKAVALQSNPACFYMPEVTSGGSFAGPDRRNPTNDSYFMNLFGATWCDATAAQATPSKLLGGSTGFPTDHLRVLYLLKPDTFSMTNYADSLLTNGVSLSNIHTAPTYKCWDRLGILGVCNNNDDHVTGYTWTNILTGFANATGDTEAYGTSASVGICFAHYPYQFTPPGQSLLTINDGVAGEKVMTGGDLAITRHGSTFGGSASWDFAIGGGTGTASLADGSFGCFLLVRSGTGANSTKLYASGDVPLTGAPNPLVPSATFTASGASNAGRVIFSDNTNYLAGVVSLYSRANTAWTDAQIYQWFKAAGLCMRGQCMPGFMTADGTSTIAGH